MFMIWKTIVKMCVLLKAIFRFIAITIKSSMTIFTEIEQTIIKYVWNYKDFKELRQSQE